MKRQELALVGPDSARQQPIDLLDAAAESLHKFWREENELTGTTGAFDRALARVQHARECLEWARLELRYEMAPRLWRNCWDRHTAIVWLLSCVDTAETRLDHALSEMAVRVGRKGGSR